MQQPCTGPEKNIDLREILGILRKRYLIIALITITALAISGVMNFYVLPPVFEAKTVILVTQAVPVGKINYDSKVGLEGIIGSISTPPEMTMDTYAGQLKSEAVLQQVILKLSLDKQGYTVGRLAGGIDLTVLKDTNLIELRVTNTDRFLAAKIANTIASEFQGFMSVANERQVAAALEFLEQQKLSVGGELKNVQSELKKLEAQSTAQVASEQLSAAKKEVEHVEKLYDLIIAKINEMKIRKSMKFGETSLRIVSPAMIPDVPVGPNKTLNMMVAFMVSLMVSTGLAFLINYLDNTIKTPEQVEELFGLPVLGQIPVFKQEKTGKRD